MEFELQNHKLKELLEAHGLQCIEHNDWIVPNGDFPAICMIWYPKPEQRSGVLQVEVLIDENTKLEECVGGMGLGDEALLDAFHNFCVNSLHVLLAAFWGIEELGQIEKESWKIGGESYTAYIGPFGTRNSSENHLGIPSQAFEHIETAIKETRINEKYNWFRTYFCNLNEEKKVYEALFNNQDWPEGEKYLKLVQWYSPDTFYSVRNFLILVKNR